MVWHDYETKTSCLLSLIPKTSNFAKRETNTPGERQREGELMREQRRHLMALAAKSETTQKITYKHLFAHSLARQHFQQPETWNDSRFNNVHGHFKCKYIVEKVSHILQMVSVFLVSIESIVERHNHDVVLLLLLPMPLLSSSSLHYWHCCCVSHSHYLYSAVHVVHC